MKKLISTFLALTLSLGLCAPAFAAGTFTDVDGWAQPYIDRAASLGLVNGVGGGRFAPDSEVSYLQYAIMLCAIRYQEETAQAIADNNGEWWWPYCKVAARHGLFENTAMSNEREWDPQNGKPVPRSDMAMMVYNYMIDMGKGDMPVPLITISDIGALDKAHYDAVYFCWVLGLLRGTGGDKFSPDSFMNRAQAATVLCAVYDAVMDDSNQNKDPESTQQPDPEPVQQPDPEPVQQPEPEPVEPEEPKALLANGQEITEDNVRAIINGLRGSYPEGMPWTNDNSYTSDAMRIRGFGCAGFALICSDAAFGELPQTRQHSSFDDIRVGDILRVMNDTHSVVVLEKRANSVIVTEGNFNSSIHWDREITRQALESQNFYVSTRYPA